MLEGKASLRNEDQPIVVEGVLMTSSIHVASQQAATKKNLFLKRGKLQCSLEAWLLFALDMPLLV